MSGLNAHISFKFRKITWSTYKNIDREKEKENED